MQQNNQLDELIEVQSVTNNIINSILEQCKNILKDHLINNSISFYTQHQTINLVNNLIIHYLDVPNVFQVMEDNEPIPTIKDAFSNQIITNLLKKQYDSEISKENTTNRFKKSTSRMKASSYQNEIKKSEIIVSDNMKYDIIKLQQNEIIDDDIAYYRKQYEQQVKVLESIARKQSLMEEVKSFQKHQIEIFLRRQQKGSITYDNDGSILQQKQPIIRQKIYQLQCQVLKKKQTNNHMKISQKVKTQTSTIDNILLSSQTRRELLTMNLKTEDREIEENKLQESNAFYDQFTKDKIIKSIMNDESLKMTKKQYQQASDLFSKQPLIDLNKRTNSTFTQQSIIQHDNNEKNLDIFRKKTISSTQRGGLIKFGKKYQELSINEDQVDQKEEKQIIFQNAEKQQHQLDNKKYNNNLLIFQPPQGKLPNLKPIFQVNSKKQKSGRSITQYY